MESFSPVSILRLSPTRASFDFSLAQVLGFIFGLGGPQSCHTLPDPPSPTLALLSLAG